MFGLGKPSVPADRLAYRSKLVEQAAKAIGGDDSELTKISPSTEATIDMLWEHTFGNYAEKVGVQRVIALPDGLGKVLSMNTRDMLLIGYYFWNIERIANNVEQAGEVKAYSSKAMYKRFTETNYVYVINQMSEDLLEAMQVIQVRVLNAMVGAHPGLRRIPRDIYDEIQNQTMMLLAIGYNLAKEEPRKS